MAENTPIISFRDADILNGEATVIYGLNKASDQLADSSLTGFPKSRFLISEDRWELYSRTLNSSWTEA